MLHLQLNRATTTQVTVVPCPVWETIASLTVLTRLRRRGAGTYLRWARDVQRRVSHEQVSHLWRAVSGSTPPPPLWEAQPNFNRDFPDPGVADSLSSYWNDAIAPYWDGMSTALHSEMQRRNETLASRGWSSMLSRLDGRYQWRPPLLAAPHHEEIRYVATGPSLQLVPMIFGGAWSLFTALPADVVSFSYPLSITTGLRRPQPPPEQRQPQHSDDALTILVGGRRACLLRALRKPATTTQLAHELGLAPSTTSEHLRDLVAAGTVRRHRRGHEVFYELDRGGFTMLEEFG